MPRSRSRSPNPRDRYSGNRYRGAGGGGGPSNSGNVRRRNSRSRSRSPRDRDGRNDRTHRDRYQQRTERPAKRHSRSRSPSPKAFGNKIVEKKSEPTTNRIFDPSELQGKTEDEIEMLKAMGFASFDTTKGKHTEGSTNAYGVNIQQKRRYRQYMNRKGGFNRPLDPIA